MMKAECETAPKKINSNYATIISMMYGNDDRGNEEDAFNDDPMAKENFLSIVTQSSNSTPRIDNRPKHSSIVMANTIFKYHQHSQQHQHQHNPNYPYHQGHGSGNSSSISGGIATIDGNNSNHNQNNSNQNSIFVLNAEAKISPNSCRKFYLDFNDNPMDSSATLTQQSTAASATAGNGVNSNFSSFPSASSVWSSASSTMCSPAAHAIQKLFNCSSGGGGGGGVVGAAGSATKHYGNLSSGIDSKSSALTSSSSFKSSKSELLKKKSKFWQYLEGETQSTTTSYEGIDSSKKGKGKSRKHKSKYWPKSNANDDDDNQNSHNDLSELLEYSCSLCDNCRCMDCQIGYFDCDNSDDSNSEYSFHMNAYEEDDDDDIERGMELKATITTAARAQLTSAASTPPSDDSGEAVEEDAEKQHALACNKIDNKNAIQQLEFESSSRRSGGSHATTKHEMAECCHQCYGLEVEQHCLDFHQLYNSSECCGSGGGGVAGATSHRKH
ncbi:probable cyclin-dependent serine/threonine-protein kinase DDB_G0292550 [Musca vetustissima]|uniref:probable cyclin-dependent serine/threonine-protein kinase DDB_G0292550 n=1 Tax=Musca vetustissima TaxID=27455 RepID=UPI002AB6447F|nr:probable cyclin-dependent serine/threonine-protein kinase DDB_G0292550 [Musca vetustissima]